MMGKLCLMIFIYLRFKMADVSANITVEISCVLFTAKSYIQFDSNFICTLVMTTQHLTLFIIFFIEDGCHGGRFV